MAGWVDRQIDSWCDQRINIRINRVDEDPALREGVTG